MPPPQTQIVQFQQPFQDPVPKTKHKFSDYAWYWYETYKKNNISSKYKVTLEARIGRLCKYFSDVSVEDFTVESIQTFVNSLSSLNKSSIGYLKNALSQILDSAVEDGIITKNPAKSKRIQINGVESVGRKALSMDECRRLVSLLPQLYPSQSMCIALMLYAGLRREEMLGLKWQDIDFDRRLIHVERAIIFGKYGAAEIKGTKNKSSKRIVPMSDPLFDILYPNRGATGFVVTDAETKMFNDNTYKAFWENIRTQVGMPRLDARELRHTFATLNAAAGVDMKTIGGFMGHSKIATTAEIYTQLEPEHMHNMRNAMADYMSGRTN